MTQETRAHGAGPTAFESGLVVVDQPLDFGAPLNVNSPEMKQAIEAVKGITRDIFSNRFTLTEREDHEIAGDRSIEVHVIDEGEVDAILARADEWYHAVCKPPPGVRGFFCLSVE